MTWPATNVCIEYKRKLELTHPLSIWPPIGPPSAAVPSSRAHTHPCHHSPCAAVHSIHCCSLSDHSPDCAVSVGHTPSDYYCADWVDLCACSYSSAPHSRKCSYPHPSASAYPAVASTASSPSPNHRKSSLTHHTSPSR